MSTFNEHEAEKHPAYNDAKREAVRRAAEDQHGGSYTVYWNGSAVFVRPSGAIMPLGARLVCIAQRWDEKTVQLRFAGARSEWVPV